MINLIAKEPTNFFYSLIGISTNIKNDTEDIRPYNQDLKIQFFFPFFIQFSLKARPEKIRTINKIKPCMELYDKSKNINYNQLTKLVMKFCDIKT